ncbi:MAG: carbonic anhydrase [Corynebacterium sp.]|nr:carbonic anhydrase [Corynebacterium sp.]
MTPNHIWQSLKRGNERFVHQATTRPNQDLARRAALTTGQSPKAVVLACSDSRVPVELVFDQGLGDVFVIRTAGEIVDQAVLSSLEYAVDALRTPLIVVMGHESCGAVKAAASVLDGKPMPGGFQRVLIEKVSPSIAAAQASGLTETSEFETHHIAEIVDFIISCSPTIRGAFKDGHLGMIGARYRLADGAVEPVIAVGVDL